MEEGRFRHLEIKLDEQLRQDELIKNKFSRKFKINQKQIDNYCKNNIARLDVYVLCKLCSVLECRIETY